MDNFFYCEVNQGGVSSFFLSFQRSSMVEQRTVNAHVVGSSPTAGAIVRAGLRNPSRFGGLNQRLGMWRV